MASPMQRLADALAFLSPQRKAAVLRAANENPALYAKLMQATEADDFNKTLRMVVANDAGQWGAAPARPAPVRPEAPAALTTAQRMMRDPNIRPAIDANLDRLPPELAERIAADDPDAFMEAFQMIAEADGELPLRTLDNVPPPAGRQMELPLGGQNELPQRGLVPFGVRGEGVPVGGPSGAGTLVGEPISAGVPIYPMSNFERALANPTRQRWDGFGFPSQYRHGPARIGTTAGTLFDGPPPARGMIQHPRMGGPRDMIVRQPERTSMRDIAAATIAAGAAGGGGYMAGRELGDELFNQDAASETQAMGDDLQITTDDTVEMTSDGTADLAAETTPPPSVPTKESAYPSWKRVIDEGYVPLGDATPEEINRAHARMNNMIDMGMGREEAQTKAYDGMAAEVVARAKRKAEAFLQANPGF